MSGALWYLAAFVLTQVVEAPVYVVLLVSVLGVSWRRALAGSVGVNLISHPLFFLVFVPITDAVLRPTAGIIAAEVLVWEAETAMLAVWLRRDYAALAATSLAANASSFAAGLLLLR